MWAFSGKKNTQKYTTNHMGSTNLYDWAACTFTTLFGILE